MKRAALLLLLALPLCSCAYFNGMYNARRLAGGARKAEREGRSFEATRLWGLASTKAESLQVQHPRSKYVPEARLIQATALARGGDCESAAPMAERAMAAVTETRLIEDAALLLGRCSEAQNDPVAALDSYSRLLSSKDANRRAEAVYRHARAERLMGLYQAAVNDLARSDHPQARGERAAALMGLGEIDDAMVLVDTLIAAHDTLVPWNDLIQSYGRADPARASALVDRLARDTSFKASSRVEWIVGDAERLTLEDPQAAVSRLALADSLGGRGSPRSRQVELSLLRSRISRVTTLAELAPMVDLFTDMGERGGAAAPEAYRTVRAAQLVLVAADSSQRAAPQFDLRLFLAAEVSRDSLGANQLAADLLHQIMTGWPASPYAAKAALAISLIRPEGQDSITAGTLARSAGSPYLLALRGDAAPGYQQLEDSLLKFMSGYNPQNSGRRRPPARPGAKPASREPTITP